MSAVTLTGLSKSFGSTIAVADINITVSDGEFFVVLGPSRSGKSTVLRLIAGLESASDGTIMFDDRDVTHVRPAERDVGMFFQNVVLYPNKTGYENIASALRVHHLSPDQVAERVQRVAELLGVTHLLDRKPVTYSGGEQQRVAIGRVIARDVHVYLFDEPLSNLDALVRVRLRTEFKRLQRELGITTFFVTSDQVEALALADRVMVLQEGRVAQVGPPLDVYRQPDNAFVASFVGSPPMNILAGTLEHHDSAVDAALTFHGTSGGRVEILGPPGAEWPIGQRLLFGVRPEHLELGPPGGEAKIVTLESLGRRTLAYVDLNGTP
jgi:ABC-type sugar transport system ATPase subunit